MLGSISNVCLDAVEGEKVTVPHAAVPGLASGSPSCVYFYLTQASCRSWRDCRGQAPSFSLWASNGLLYHLAPGRTMAHKTGRGRE